jgi:hypothetical protein
VDRSLADRLNELWKQADVLKEAEQIYLRMEAERKPMLAQLTIKALGKSFAERESIALASEDWRAFMAGHVAAESAFNYERRKFEILEKAYLAEHATFKLDDRSIRKPGVA